MDDRVLCGAIRRVLLVGLLTRCWGPGGEGGRRGGDGAYRTAVCLFCFYASQHTLNQRRLQQYTSPTVYVSSKFALPSRFWLTIPGNGFAIA